MFIQLYTAATTMPTKNNIAKKDNKNSIFLRFFFIISLINFQFLVIMVNELNLVASLYAFHVCLLKYYEFLILILIQTKF